MRRLTGRFIVIAATVVLSLLTVDASAESRREYRAFWVDTFNTLLSTHANVVTVVQNAKAANANAIFAQVRRRGDSWYLNSLEPSPDFLSQPIPAGFDPLQDLINEAHANNLEVHAFVIVGAIWNKNPTSPPSATLGPPTNPNHVFNRHGGYDPATRTIVPGPDNWLTRTLLPDGAASITFQGHRFGNDFWLDPGHPGAAAHTADVLTTLVRNYDLDGLHLDRIRYPEIGVSGQTPTTGTSIGYNATNVARFQTYYGLPASPFPATGNAQWMQWRRDQVTNLVRRVYLNAIAIRPRIRVSAALIAFGSGPLTESHWTGVRGEAYWRVYQDWRSWTQEGILDIAIPMNYKSEHTSTNRVMFDEWNEWLKNHQYDRAGMIGMVGFATPTSNNAVEGLLRQTRRALAPSSTGNTAAGVIYFSMANINAAVTANPFSFPTAGVNTPLRTFAQAASGLRTGKFGSTVFEDPDANPVAIFDQPVLVPDFAWKSAPTKGHVMGFAKRGDATPLDTATVTIENASTGDQRSTATDGGGFYGGVDLVPGAYFVKAVLRSDTLWGCTTPVIAGQVAVADLTNDKAAPQLSLPAPISVAAEPGSCSAAVTFNIASSDCLPVSIVTTLTSGTPVSSGARFPVGSTTVNATATDRAGNSVTESFTVTVRDEEAPAISDITTSKTTLFPPNHKMVKVRVSYGISDNCAVASTRLTVTSSDPENAEGDGNSERDFEVIDEHEVALRAERSGSGGDRVYTITVTVTDASGNVMTTATTIVTVPHDAG